VTLGRPRSWFFDNCEDAVVRAVEEALDVLVCAGATIKEVDIPAIGMIDADLIKHILVGAEAASYHQEVQHRWARYTPGMQDVLAFGTSLSATDYLRAQRLRKPLFDAVQTALHQVDALVMPTSGITAPPRSAQTIHVDGAAQPLGEVVARNTSIFNITGHPALTVPCGFTDDALPVGLQVVAAPWHEATCLRIGAALQDLTDHHLQMPPPVPSTAQQLPEPAERTP
jgi:Asp-tRNA(Asn)/Glu-tRNA(Gln) amidotransferase A subunit family amidase